MSKFSDYTEYARRFSLRHPVISFVGKQVNFWIAANLFLGVIIHLHSLLLNEIQPTPQLAGLDAIVLIAVIFGLVYGTILGLCDYYLDQHFFRKKPLGKIIIFKLVISLILLVTLIALFKYSILPFTDAETRALLLEQNNKFWDIFFLLLVVYYFFMTLTISFINQMNLKYGPGIILPLLFGKYRNPREENRLFMFMDLNASTTIAEKLGHIKYSGFIRDCFSDINAVVSTFNAEIYQYVGDEIIVTWPLNKMLNISTSPDFFFACEQMFDKRKQYYLQYYDTVPSFKAGVHLGKVTAVEIGEIKRDIAYHGDTLNTTARILSLCNTYKKNILISEAVLEYVSSNHLYRIERLGKITLKGKIQEVEIAGIQPA